MTSNKNFTQPPKYINDFSKALASEVRILLAEVGKLRDERRALQFEIAELMSVKSKHGAGGEYSEWRAKADGPPAIEGAPPPPAIEDAPAGPARPGWHTVHKRPARKDKALTAKEQPPQSPPPIEAPRPNVPAWAQWRPNPLLAPAPVVATSSTPMPNSPSARSGLFGPPTPPPK